MPTSTEQDAASGALLTNREVGRLMSVIQDKTFKETRALANALQLKDDDDAPLPEVEQALLQQTRADLAYFFDTLPDGTIQAGEDYSAPRDKEEARQRMRLRLGLPAVSPTIAEQLAAADSKRRPRRASQTVPTTTVFG